MERERHPAVRRWQAAGRVVLFDALDELRTRVAAAWAGAPLEGAELHRHAREVAAMRTRAGDVGPADWWAQWLRARAGRWARTVVEDVRAGRRTPPEGSPAAVLARHRTPQGALLDVPVAAVELLDVVRPIAAVGRFGVYAALSLLRHPQWRGAFAAVAGNAGLGGLPRWPALPGRTDDRGAAGPHRAAAHPGHPVRRRRAGPEREPAADPRPPAGGLRGRPGPAGGVSGRARGR
ncbi:hypothetical protein ACI8AC_09770 [Geodermatophilus sp. SYSU D00758]